VKEGELVMGRTTLLIAVLLLTAGFAGAQELFSEDFEVEPPGSYDANPSSYGGPSSDDSYWGQNNNADNTFSGFGGTYFWGGSDLDDVGTHGGSVPAILTFSDIDLQGYTHLTFEGLFAATTNQESGDGDSLKVYYKVDNDPTENPLFLFEATGSGSPLAEVGGTGVLSTVMTSYSKTFSVPGGAEKLTLIIKAMNGSNPEVCGFDNLKITPEPMTMSLLALGGLGLLRRRRA
jgi:hypothetical protein